MARDIFPRYETRCPAHQNAIDALPGWCTSLPGVTAGPLATYADMRIAWLAAQMGGVAGCRVLELGPLEGGHTAQLEALGADVLALEGNRLAYLRCLVAKEVFGLTRARFLLGDFVKWLAADETRYDLVVACGVLYHMADPAQLLRLLAARADALYLWTHCVDDAAMPIGDPRRAVLADTPDVVDCAGVAFRVFRRTYAGAEHHASFSGGPIDAHAWPHRDDLLAALRAFGYGELHVAHDEPGHVNGPSLSIFARRRNTTARV